MKNYYLIITLLILSFYKLSANEYIEKAKELYIQNQHTKSIDLLKLHIAEIIDTKDQEMISELYYGIGVNYYKLGVLDSSLKYLLISENTNLKSKNIKFSTLVYNDLSVCLNELGLHHESLYYLKKSLSMNIELNNERGTILNLLNLGNTYYYMNNINTAMTYYSKARQRIKKKDSNQYLNLLNSISVIRARNGDYKNAISILEQAIGKRSAGMDSMRIYLYTTNLDMYLIADGQSSKYEDLLENYLQYSKIHNETKFADANFKASIYQLAKGDFKNALGYLNNANSIYVSNNNLFKAREITQYFRKMMNILKIKGMSNIDILLNQLKEKSIVRYSEALETEINVRLSIEEELSILNTKLSYSIIGIEILVILIVILCISVPLTIKYFIDKRLFYIYKIDLIEYYTGLKKTHDMKVKNSIGKMTNLMLLSRNFKDDDIFVETIEDLIEGSNELSNHINNFNQFNRSKYVNTTSTNKLQLDRSHTNL